LRQHLGIALQFVRIGLIRKSQFRAEFLIQVVMDTCWYASHVLTFEVLFLHTSSIAGWQHADIRVLLGFLFVSDAFMMVWLGQAWHFGRELADGKLDPVRVRPASPIFLYFFQRFSLEGFINMTMAFGYLGYALAVLERPLGPGLAAITLWAVLLSWWARTVLSVFFTLFEFRFLNSDLGHFLGEFFMPAVDRPLDIFALRIRQFLLFIIPVGALSYLPASLVLGRVSVGAGVLYTVWLLLLGLLVFRLWNRGFRHYESALG